MKKTPEPVKKASPVKKAPEPVKNSAKTSALVSQINVIKAQANIKFKAQDFEMAIFIYSEAVTLYKKENCPRSEELDTLIGQVFTNRALMYHNIGD